jgi:ferric-dicitrate binding protein FerR (iron transport regulator)
MSKMNKDLYTKKTDEAWNKVHARIVQDGLVDKENSLPARTIALRWRVIIAAASVLVCVVLSAVYFVKGNRSETQLLTQRNDEGIASLAKTLEDGSVVYLAGKSSLQYPIHFPSDKREVLLQGNAYFDVARNKARPFVIKTKKVLIEVLGTAFNVRSVDGRPFELSVNRGKVRVINVVNGNRVLVEAGNTVILNSQGLHLQKTREAGQFEQYINCIRFKDEKLDNILKVINLKSTGIKLQTVPRLANRRLTVSFSDDSPVEMAILISNALNVKYSVKDDRITIK